MDALHAASAILYAAEISEQVSRDTLCGRILDMKDENNHITGKCYVISLIDVEPVGEASIVH